MCANMYPKKYVKNGFAIYETYSGRLLSTGVKTRRNKDDDNILDVECHACKKWYSPSTKNVADKLSAAYGIKGRENNLYCSEKCKVECPTFGFNSHQCIDPRSSLYIKKSEQSYARNCQANSLKKLQLDEFGYNFCENVEIKLILLNYTIH